MKPTTARAALLTASIASFVLGALFVPGIRRSTTEAQSGIKYRYEIQQPILITPVSWNDKTAVEYRDRDRLTRIGDDGGEILNPVVSGGHIRSGEAHSQLVLIRYRR